MGTQDYQAALRDRMRQIPLGEAPRPWRCVTNAAVGGLTEVGFAEGTEWLLVVSWQGRGVFDGRTGLRVARDDNPPDNSWYDGLRLVARGIGPIEDQWVRIAGLHGGGFPRITVDGWKLTQIAPDWPEESIVLEPPGGSVLIERFAKGCVRLAEDSFRAFGFSDSGASFLLAMSHSVLIWHRDGFLLDSTTKSSSV